MRRDKRAKCGWRFASQAEGLGKDQYKPSSHSSGNREPRAEEKTHEELLDGFTHYLFPDWLEYIGKTMPPF